MGLWAAAHAAGLLLARVDAGVLDEDETRVLAATVTAVLGEDRLQALRGLWQAAQTTPDDDTETMLDLGRAWCATLGVDPEDPDPSEAFAGRPFGAEWTPSPLTTAVAATLRAVAAAEAPPDTRTPAQDKAAARRAEQAARATAERAARIVFAAADPGGHATFGTTSITGQRPPTPAEQAAARRLARALKQAATRDRVATTTTSATPPGRLRMRDALAADAQRAAGAVPTAEPFTRTTRRHTPSPPLRVGIACDVSGSMTAVAPAIASAAWILARAVAHVPDAKAATVIYGRYVRPVTRPGQTPTEVPVFPAADATERFTRAVDALDSALDLSRPGAARLLVIVSDGLYTPDELRTGQQRVTRLRASGCGVLWIALDHGTHPMTGATLLVLPDPAAAPEAIARAATEALRRA
jgi:hypothetical protein